MDDSLSISASLSKGSLSEDMSENREIFKLADSPAGGAGLSAVISNETIGRGDELLKTYTVISDPIKGGMGCVWQVRNPGWDMDLAMKRPQPRFFAEGGEKKKAEFISECENWINLGLHPNIVSCYYVREIGGIPTIFSEWMDNGSLKDKISNGSLYVGGKDEVAARLLDIAVQTAKGLLYAHRCGLIHQDVKPGNILLNGKWAGKVADFGLARAQSDLAGDSGAAGSAGYTLAYCPAEQARGEKPEKWMDVYSWALTVLEMYTGKRLWETGARAAGDFEAYTEHTAVALPEGVCELLKSCITDRIDDFAFIAEQLKKIYADVTGKAYPRPDYPEVRDTANVLNNKALSFIDLGMPEKAEQCLEEAVRMSPETAESQINRVLFKLRQGKTDETAALKMLNSLAERFSCGEYITALTELNIECARLPQARELSRRLDSEEEGRHFEEIIDSCGLCRIELDYSRWHHKESRRLSREEAAAMACGKLYINTFDNNYDFCGGQQREIVLTYPSDTEFSIGPGDRKFAPAEGFEPYRMTKFITRRGELGFALCDCENGTTVGLEGPQKFKNLPVNEWEAHPDAIKGKNKVGEPLIEYMLAEVLEYYCDSEKAHIAVRYEPVYKPVNEPGEVPLSLQDSEWEIYADSYTEGYNPPEKTLDFVYDVNSGALLSDRECSFPPKPEYREANDGIRKKYPRTYELIAPDSECLHYDEASKTFRLDEEAWEKKGRPALSLVSAYLSYEPDSLRLMPWRLSTVTDTDAARRQAQLSQQYKRAFYDCAAAGDWAGAIKNYDAYGEVPGSAFSDEEGEMEDLLFEHCERTGIKEFSVGEGSVRTQACSPFIEPTAEAEACLKRWKPPVLGKYYKHDGHLYTVSQRKIVRMMRDGKTALMDFHLFPVINGVGGLPDVFVMMHIPTRTVLYTLFDPDEKDAADVTMTEDCRYLFARMDASPDRRYSMDTLTYEPFPLFSTEKGRYRTENYAASPVTPDSGFMYISSLRNEKPFFLNLKTGDRTPAPSMHVKAFSKNGRFLGLPSADNRELTVKCRIRWRYTAEKR